MVVMSVWIINQIGGLLYHKDFAKSKGEANDYLKLANMFDVLSAHAKEVSPLDNSSGIFELEAETFKLHSLETLVPPPPPPTGLKFVVLLDSGPVIGDVRKLLGHIYECYTDYVLKDPDYVMDSQGVGCQSIKSHRWEARLAKLVEDLQST
eukprot:gene3600-4039_t